MKEIADDSGVMADNGGWMERKNKYKRLCRKDYRICVCSRSRNIRAR